MWSEKYTLSPHEAFGFDFLTQIEPTVSLKWAAVSRLSV